MQQGISICASTDFIKWIGCWQMMMWQIHIECSCFINVSIKLRASSISYIHFHTVKWKSDVWSVLGIGTYPELMYRTQQHTKLQNKPSEFVLSCTVSALDQIQVEAKCELITRHIKLHETNRQNNKLKTHSATLNMYVHIYSLSCSVYTWLLCCKAFCVFCCILQQLEMTLTCPFRIMMEALCLWNQNVHQCVAW